MLGGCAQAVWSTQTTETPSPRVAEAYKFIPNDCAAKRATQERIAEHNSVHATVTTGKDTIYRPKTQAECARRAPRRPSKRKVPTS